MPEVHELIQRRFARDSLRTIARATHLDRKTVRRYVAALDTMGITPTTVVEVALARRLASRVQARPAPAQSTTRSALRAHSTRIAAWLAEKVPLIEQRARLEEGYSLVVAYPTLRRFAMRELGWRPRPQPFEPQPAAPATPTPPATMRPATAPSPFDKARVRPLLEDETCFWSVWSNGDGETVDIDTLDFLDPTPNAEETLLAVERLRAVLMALAAARH